MTLFNVLRSLFIPLAQGANLGHAINRQHVPTYGERVSPRHDAVHDLVQVLHRRVLCGIRSQRVAAILLQKTCLEILNDVQASWLHRRPENPVP